MMSKKLNLDLNNDNTKIIKDFLDIMHIHKLDYTNTFINLENNNLDKNIFKDWYIKYNNLKNKKFDKINPIVIPRNHLIEQIINESHSGNFESLYEYEKILKNPYNRNIKNKFTNPPTENEKIYETFCGTWYYFIAPSVRPDTKYFPIKINSKITGKLANTAPDSKKPQSIWYWPTIEARPTGKVFKLSPLINIEAKRYSVQEIMKQKIETLAMPGAAKGTTILDITTYLDAPSIYAASSISFGINLKKAFNIHTANGVANKTLTMINAK